MKLRYLLLFTLLALARPAAAQTFRQLFPDYTSTNCVCYTNKLVVTTNAARALRINVHNSDTADLWLHVFDRSTNNVPAAGTLPSLPPLKILAGTTGGWDYQGVPELFRNGIIIAPSTTDRAFTNAGAVFFIRASYDGKAN